MPRPETKYRPYLTLRSIKYIAENIPDPGLKSYFANLAYKIEAGLMKENHTTHPRTTLEEKLGIDGESKGSRVTQEEIDAENARAIALFSADAEN